MLRIKDNVDLEELKKYGFRAKYNEDTGKIIAYQKTSKETEYDGMIIKSETYKKIRIFKRTKSTWIINKYNEYFDIDTLYDLIEAGLVEKYEK